MSEKKKKEELAAVIDKKDIPLTQLMLDATKDKYRLVALATRWAQEVKQRDPQSGISAQELINMALKEILTGQVTAEAIEKLAPIPKVEKKASEPILKFNPDRLDDEKPSKGGKGSKLKDLDDEDEE